MAQHWLCHHQMRVVVVPLDYLSGADSATMTSALLCGSDTPHLCAMTWSTSQITHQMESGWNKYVHLFHRLIERGVVPAHVLGASLIQLLLGQLVLVIAKPKPSLRRALLPRSISADVAATACTRMWL